MGGVGQGCLNTGHAAAGPLSPCYLNNTRAQARAYTEGEDDHQLPMGWNPSVMRKFAATSHQRLIHQLRSELQNDHTAQRLPATVTEPDGSATTGPRVSASSQEQKQEKRPRSFRERLNAVDLR